MDAHGKSVTNRVQMVQCACAGESELPKNSGLLGRSLWGALPSVNWKGNCRMLRMRKDQEFVVFMFFPILPIPSHSFHVFPLSHPEATESIMTCCSNPVVESGGASWIRCSLSRCNSAKVVIIYLLSLPSFFDMKFWVDLPLEPTSSVWSRAWFNWNARRNAKVSRLRCLSDSFEQRLNAKVCTRHKTG